MFKIEEAQWPIGYGVGLRIKRSSVRIRPWPLRWVLGQGSLLPLSQGEAFTLASISSLAILVKYMLAKKTWLFSLAPRLRKQAGLDFVSTWYLKISNRLRLYRGLYGRRLRHFDITVRCAAHCAAATQLGDSNALHRPFMHLSCMPQVPPPPPPPEMVGFDQGSNLSENPTRGQRKWLNTPPPAGAGNVWYEY